MLEYALVKVLDEVVSPFIGKNKVEPIFTTNLPGITYTSTPISDGAVKENQIEVKVIHKYYDDALAIEKEIVKKLNTNVNEPSLLIDNIVLHGQLSGGGSIFNDSIQTWELSMIFIIKWRRLNE